MGKIEQNGTGDFAGKEGGSGGQKDANNKRGKVRKARIGLRSERARQELGWQDF